MYHESETVTKYEIMDGAPVKGECVGVSPRGHCSILFSCLFNIASPLIVRSCLPHCSPLTRIVQSLSAGESIPIRLFLAGFDLTPTMRDVNKKFSVRYYLNLVLVDEEVSVR